MLRLIKKHSKLLHYNQLYGITRYRYTVPVFLIFDDHFCRNQKSWDPDTAK